MVIVYALLAALSNAVNEATQHVASIAAPRRTSGWRLMVYLFRNPLWLFGWAALAGAFVFQALVSIPTKPITGSGVCDHWDRRPRSGRRWLPWSPVGHLLLVLVVVCHGLVVLA